MASGVREAATRYEVDGENLPEGLAHITARGGDIRFDGSAGGGEELPGPADLLAAALAACILKKVERFSKILRFSYRRATVHVAVEREDPPTRLVHARYTLRVEPTSPSPGSNSCIATSSSSARSPARWPRRLSCTARSLRSVSRTARAPSAREPSSCREEPPRR
jgi:uncharacterized OsmC-like protein